MPFDQMIAFWHNRLVFVPMTGAIENIFGVVNHHVAQVAVLSQADSATVGG